MLSKKYFRIGLVVILIGMFITGCGPSPEEQAATAAAQTAAAATSTPTITPSPTPTPTPTPVPYDLSVSVLGVEDTPLIGAAVFFAEVMDEEWTMITDESGQVFWNNLPGETVNLSISSQGYLPQDASELIDRGPNQITITLERDPFGMLPSEACSPGENLLYIEDFQDNEAEGWFEINFNSLGWEILPHPDTPQDIVAGHSGDQSSRSNLEGSDLNNAVWRVYLMLRGSGKFFLNWNWAEPTSVEGGDYSVYQMDWSPSWLAFYRYVAPSFHLNVSEGYQPIEENQWHKFEVSYFEGRSEVWMDDDLWLAYQDPHPLPSGKIGLEIRQTDDENFRIFFDDMSICDLSAPFVPKPTPEL